MINRDKEIVELFISGATIIGLADKYGISKQRIHQILRRDGISAGEGGRTVRRDRRIAILANSKDQFCHKKYGCSWEQYQEILSMRNMMKVAGKGWNTTPLAAYYSQRSNSKQRGIPFNLTLWEWWSIWRDSGKWDERSPTGYVMCRNGDIGAYEVGNVFIDTAINNLASVKKPEGALPVGVSVRHRQDGDKYIAIRMINRASKYLGTFDTPELAHEAYISANPCNFDCG